MIKQIELHLVDGSAPSGEITLKDLSGIAAALQELVTRLSREAADAAGPGRSKQYVEEFAELRLDAITAGSTVLKVSKGPTDKLDVDVPGLTEADDRLWDILGAISADQRPEWTSTLVAESVGKLATALRGSSTDHGHLLARPCRCADRRRTNSPPRPGRSTGSPPRARAPLRVGWRRSTCTRTRSGSVMTSQHRGTPTGRRRQGCWAACRAMGDRRGGGRDAESVRTRGGPEPRARARDGRPRGRVLGQSCRSPSTRPLPARLAQIRMIGSTSPKRKRRSSFGRFVHDCVERDCRHRRLQLCLCASEGGFRPSYHRLDRRASATSGHHFVSDSRRNT